VLWLAVNGYVIHLIVHTERVGSMGFVRNYSKFRQPRSGFLDRYLSYTAIIVMATT